ncbi:MAG: Asp-tRNA(Asn)/Glu-tRNA(Gln) amidotransferase subunit GatB [Cyclobacteriaceae bacterium]
MTKYIPTIGLEVHIQLSTASKIFCADANEYGSEPNTNISEISLAHPGTLPKLNKKAVESAIKLGLACNCEIAKEMFFDRKNYFYPDLPKGYQLTQDKTPICSGGEVSIGDKKIALTKIHLEEDAGKLIHDQNEEFSCVDYNRAGVPLCELVTEPVIHEAKDAALFLAEIRKVVRFLEIGDGDMEKGSLRCDANISIAPEGSPELGSKVEIKNMNSFKHVQKAIEYEIKRQTSLLQSQEEIISETRLYDIDSGETYGMRTKEELNDYRYFPEPDLCRFEVSEEQLKQISQSMPRLHWDYKAEFIKNGIKPTDAEILAETKNLAIYFDSLCDVVTDKKAAANWVIGPVKSHLNNRGISIVESNLSVDRLAELINLVTDNRVSFSIASSSILPILFEDENATAENVAKDLNLLIDNASEDVDQLIQTIFEKHPEKVKAYKNGKKGLLGMFMGELMRESNGKIDPKKANDLLVAALNH